MRRIIIVSPDTLKNIEEVLTPRDIGMGLEDASPKTIMPILESLLELNDQGKALLILPE